MSKTAKQIAEQNQNTLAAIAEGKDGIDWLTHPFVGFHTVALANTDLFVMFSNNDCSTVRSLVWEREFEDLSLRIWTDRCEASAAVFDIGANTGCYCLAAAAVNGNASIFAFEPLPDAFGRLCLNIEVNQFETIHPFQQAVTHTEATFALDWNKKPYRLINTGARVRYGVKHHAEQMNRIKVRAVKLDDLLEKVSIEGQVILKIDVEGAEEAVLLGAEKMLTRYRPDILLEILDPAKMESLFRYLRPHGYRLFRVLESSGRVISERESAITAYNRGDWNWFATVDPEFDPARYDTTSY
jgi:FkbM family methyltransferase